MTPPDTKSAEERALVVCLNILQDDSAHEPTCYSCDTIAAALRAAKIEAWQEAARAVCVYCASPAYGPPIKNTHPNSDGGYYHDEGMYKPSCYASVIVALIAAAAPPREEGEK